MPALTGLLLAIPLGRFLQRQENIVKWFSIARLLVITSYALTGVVSFFIPKEILVNSILLIWALATIPQTLVSITFSVVMNAVAGPDRRFDLMSRRWSTMGLTTTLAVLGIGQMLDRVLFPLNYQLFIAHHSSPQNPRSISLQTRTGCSDKRNEGTGLERKTFHELYGETAAGDERHPAFSPIDPDLSCPRRSCVR